MSPKLQKITAVVVAVIFLMGILPYSLNRFFGTNDKKKSLQVRMLMPDQSIKAMTLEEYLIGVVAAEMPAEFQVEALKAQAVAARTYALKRMAQTGNGRYDVDTTEKTQAWNSNEDMIRKWGVLNYFKYRKKIQKAVDETEGRVLTFNGQKIDAVYFSSCGRKNTEQANEVWRGGEVAYLISVPSVETTPLRFVKHQTYDVATFYTMLGFSQMPTQFYENDLIVIDRTKAGRVKNIAVKDRIFEGTDFRAKLQLPSTDFEWKVQGKKIEIVTYGKGHAVGMSQYGANDLAAAGRSYMEILGHFYPGTRLEKL